MITGIILLVTKIISIISFSCYMWSVRKDTRRTIRGIK